MKFFTDGHRHIGTSHVLKGQPCEDAVQFGLLGDGSAAYAIACDGCSSGGRTDLGSEVYARVTAQAIANHFAVTGDLASDEALARVLHDQRIRELSLRDQLQLTPGDMLSTVAFACVGPSGGMVHVQGDGVIAMVDDAGFTTMVRTDWGVKDTPGENAPAYPAYRDDNYARFIALQGDDLSTVCYLQTQAAGQISVPDDFSEQRYHVTLKEGISKGTTYLFDESTLATTRMIAVFTDGVQQMVSGGNVMDWHKVVAALLDGLKPGRSLFARKRLNMFLKRNGLQEGDGPVDDIAYAAILIEPPQQKED